MKLMNIKLKNVKCFDKLTLHLVKPETQEPLSVCAFVGPNGTGKSTILDSLVHKFIFLQKLRQTLAGIPSNPMQLNINTATCQ